MNTAERWIDDLDEQPALNAVKGYPQLKPLDVCYPGSDGYVLSQLRELIDTHFKEEHAVDFYANALNSSTSTLKRLCKRLTGKTAYDLLQDRLHREAVLLLRYTTLSFKQISNLLGVCDPAYFSRCFKIRTGYCPREYRRSFDKKNE